MAPGAGPRHAPAGTAPAAARAAAGSEALEAAGPHPSPRLLLRGPPSLVEEEPSVRLLQEALRHNNPRHSRCSPDVSPKGRKDDHLHTRQAGSHEEEEQQGDSRRSRPFKREREAEHADRRPRGHGLCI